MSKNEVLYKLSDIKSAFEIWILEYNLFKWSNLDTNETSILVDALFCNFLEELEGKFNTDDMG